MAVRTFNHTVGSWMLGRHPNAIAAVKVEQGLEENRFDLGTSITGKTRPGIEVKDGIISHVTAGSPAATAGVLLGQKIIKINDTNVTQLSDTDLVAKLNEADSKKCLVLAPHFLFEEEKKSDTNAAAPRKCLHV
ncbi:unnamed protein product [Schistocephalus solidus]|uniref:PDZ domain-containing protein n=1 Tax=Schistocephalus solidus TaxID=70667 RepID=A0A183TFI5_SCHSO|nr:unnamed protein product [Schistocephalus solidus]